MILTSRRQQRVLADTCACLGRSDPRLVARFAVFTQLTSDEEIPPVEQVRAGLPRQAAQALLRRAGRRWRWCRLAERRLARHWLAGHWLAGRRLAGRRATGRRAAGRRGPGGRARRRLGALLFIPAAAMAMLGVLLVVSRGHAAACAAPVAATGTHGLSPAVMSGRGYYWPAPSCRAAVGHGPARGRLRRFCRCLGLITAAAVRAMPPPAGQRRRPAGARLLQAHGQSPSFRAHV